jgi:hypothetical protein
VGGLIATGNFGNERDATSISDRGLFRLLAGNLSPGVFRLLQHNLPEADIPPVVKAAGIKPTLPRSAVLAFWI